MECMSDLKRAGPSEALVSPGITRNIPLPSPRRRLTTHPEALTEKETPLGEVELRLKSIGSVWL